MKIIRKYVNKFDRNEINRKMNTWTTVWGSEDVLNRICTNGK